MNTRKDNNGKARAAWIATPPGHIAKPLRDIGNRTNGRHATGRMARSPLYLKASFYAKIGRGDLVQKIARSM